MINWPVKLIENKYSRWYEDLIHKSRTRGKISGYKEVHHIIPRSFGGEDIESNLVQLTAREHYVAHALLWKMNFEGIYRSKMAYAFNTFINKMTTEERGVYHTYKINSRTYESFRKYYSQMLKDKYAKEGGTFLGRKHTEETKKKIGEKSKLKVFKRGSEHPCWGKKIKISEEVKQFRRDKIKETWNNVVKRNEILEKRKIANQRPEVIAKRKAAADARRGVKRDPQIIEKMAITKRGKTWEELYTHEQIIRMREANKNKVLSEESKARMSYKGKGKGIPKVKKACPHCHKLCAGNMLAKWHGINCKLFKSI